MASPDRRIPDLSNATPAFLMDEIAKIRVEASRLKFLEGIYKQALEARCTPEQLSGALSIDGDAFLGRYEEVTAERISTELVREHFKDDPETLKKLVVVSTYKQLKALPK
jgi:hypothetical protein